MNYFESRYQARKAFPNAIIRKILYRAAHCVKNAGQYVVFGDYEIYQDWKRAGYVR